jgi:carboxyl-terminal processing protease
VPPRWASVGTDRPLPSRPSRLPQILILIAACLLSFSGGLVVDHVAFGPGTSATSAQSTDNGSGSSLQGSGLYEEALQVIRENFVGRSSLTDQQLLYGSIRGLVDSLGDTGHSVFLTPDEYQALQRSLGATVVGIGVVMSNSGGSLTIDKVVAGSPAATAGLKPGDLITAVDGVSTTGMTIDQVGPRIRGPEGTTVKITVVRSGSATPLDFTITRAQIAVPLVEWGIVPGTHVADIALAQFDSGASDQLKTAMNAATTAGATSIVLDLRSNPGGYASEATSVASQFLTDGVVYIEQDASGNNNSIRVDTSQPHTNLPLVVLVDHNSASSSEIVAGALQDSGRAKVVGVATFGTGTVLQQFQLSDGSVVILGTKYWLTPSGHKIFGVGIKPDEAVALPSGAVPLDPSALGSMTTAQLNSSGDAALLAAVHDLTT